jgi:hypothetical protein
MRLHILSLGVSAQGFWLEEQEALSKVAHAAYIHYEE